MPVRSIVQRWQDYTGKKAVLDGEDRTFDDLKPAMSPSRRRPPDAVAVYVLRGSGQRHRGGCQLAGHLNGNARNPKNTTAMRVRKVPKNVTKIAISTSSGAITLGRVRRKSENAKLQSNGTSA